MQTADPIPSIRGGKVWLSSGGAEYIRSFSDNLVIGHGDDGKMYSAIGEQRLSIDPNLG